MGEIYICDVSYHGIMSWIQPIQPWKRSPFALPHRKQFSGYSVYIQLLAKWELRSKIAELLALWPCFKHVWLIIIKDNLLHITGIIDLDIVDYWRRKWQPHSSVLAWRIPGTGEPGGLPSMGSHRVGHDWSDLAAAADCSFCWLLCRVISKFSLRQRKRICILLHTVW